MDLVKIKQLLEKYDNAETSLAEEALLKQYFSQKKVATHLEVYKPIFEYFEHTRYQKFTKAIQLKPQKKKAIYKWISIAAMLFVMVAVYTKSNSNPKITTIAQLPENDQKTYNKTKEIFSLIASKLEQSSKPLNALNLISNNLNKGVQKLSYVNQFSITTQKFFKK